MLMHLVDPQRLFLYHRCHHDVRRRRADRAREHRFGEMDQLGVGGQSCVLLAAPLRVGVERFVGTVGPQKTAEQRAQFGHRDGATPEARAARSPDCLNTSTNRVAWLCSTALWRLSSGDTDVAPDVDQHAPEQRVGSLVKALQAEQLEWLEQRDPQRPLFEKARPATSRTGRTTAAAGYRSRPESRRSSPANAPMRVPPFQKMPPKIAGANCATATNDTRPISTSARASPASRK